MPVNANDYNNNSIISTRQSKVFVTGSTGLLGSHLVEQLVKEGKQVKALYRSKIPTLEGSEKVDWVQGDIMDVLLLEEAMVDIAQVYHCAAVVSFNPRNKQNMFKVNVEGTANVVNAALNMDVGKLCYVSSVAALGGIRRGQEIDETMNWSEETSNSNYAKSKYLAEAEIWRAIGEGLQTVIVNPVIILGAGNWNESSTKIFKAVYEEFPWYTEGVNGFVDVCDVVRAMMQLMESNISGERFILSAENKTFKEIFTLIANAFMKKPPTKKVTPFLAELVWRFESLKAFFSSNEPLVSKETALNAQNSIYFKNNKIKEFLPGYTFTPLEVSINRICKELESKYQLVK